MVHILLKKEKCHLFHELSDTAQLDEAVKKLRQLENAETQDVTQITEAERERARAFVEMNKKAEVTGKETDIWTEYIHNKAMKKFNQNCIKELLTEHNLDNKI